MKKILYILFMLLLGIATEACSDDDQENNYIHVSPELIIARHDQTSVEIDIDANDYWQAVSDAEWCKVPSNGKGDSRIIATLDINTTTEARPDTAILTFTCGTSKATISIVQQGTNEGDFIRIKPEFISIPFDSTYLTLQVEASNELWMAEFYSNWCQIDPNNYGSSWMSVIFEKNLSLLPRPDTVKITFTCGKATTVVKITQQGMLPTTNILPYIEDQNFRTYILSKYGDPGANSFTLEQASRVTKLNFTGNNLKSAKGIEFFTNADTLNFSGNNIRSIDLSNLKKLKYLNVADNSLSALNISDLKELEMLDCSRNNNISYLDVSKCKKLRVIYCENNRIPALDLSGFVNLQLLYCNNNNLTELKVSECINLERFYCQNNGLSELNASGCVRLEYLFCNDNLLSALNLSGCTELYWLECKNNDFVTLDISQNAQLGFFEATSNPYLTEVKVWKGFDKNSSGGVFMIPPSANYVEIDT